MIAIILVGYNRVDSIKRSFLSVENAYYPSDKQVDLIFSIDNSGSDNVENYAKSVKWTHGNKKIRTFKSRQGLRKHMLSCGDFFQDYDALVIIEDDICVAQDFVNYTLQAVDFYKDDNQVAGISLYAHSIQQSNLMRFSPMKSVYDVYFLQYAASWGKVGMKNQFEEFLEWYGENENLDFKSKEIPDLVKS